MLALVEGDRPHGRSDGPDWSTTRGCPTSIGQEELEKNHWPQCPTWPVEF